MSRSGGLRRKSRDGAFTFRLGDFYESWTPLGAPLRLLFLSFYHSWSRIAACVPAGFTRLSPSSLTHIYTYPYAHIPPPPPPPPPATTDYRPTHARRAEEPLMTSPFMNTDYSSEVGTIKDYRDQPPFCCAGRRTRAGGQRERERERAQKRQGHFPPPRGRNLGRSPLFPTPSTTLSLASLLLLYSGAYHFCQHQSDD